MMVNQYNNKDDRSFYEPRGLIDETNSYVCSDILYSTESTPETHMVWRRQRWENIETIEQYIDSFQIKRCRRENKKDARESQVNRKIDYILTRNRI